MKDIKVYAVKRKDYWNPSSIEESGTLYADIDRRADFLTITYKGSWEKCKDRRYEVCLQKRDWICKDKNRRNGRRIWLANFKTFENALKWAENTKLNELIKLTYVNVKHGEATFSKN